MEGLPKAILLLLISGCPAATQRIAPYTASYYIPYTDGLLLSSHNVKVVILNRLDGLSCIDDYILNPSDDGESEKKV